MKGFNTSFNNMFLRKFKKSLILLYILVILLCLASCNRQTARQDEGLKNIIIYGDSRTGHDTHRQIVDAVLMVPPDIVFHSGDLVNNGNDPAQWTIFNEITLPLRAAADFYPAAGNHELESQLYYDNFTLPGNEKWYTVTFEDVLFIVLNSNLDLRVGSEQYNWLENVLENVDENNIKFTAIILHSPIFSTGHHYKDGLELRESIVPLFDTHGVDIVFSGHDHNYERLLCNDIYYIISGGGGAPLRTQLTTNPCSEVFISKYHFCKLNVIDDKLEVIIYDKELNIIDEFSL
jgi:predicted phosphodiesterase